MSSDTHEIPETMLEIQSTTGHVLSIGRGFIFFSLCLEDCAKEKKQKCMTCFETNWE